MSIHVPAWLVWALVGVVALVAAGPLLGLVVGLVEKRKRASSGDLRAIEAAAKDWAARKP
jgi:hypothetical protein